MKELLYKEFRLSASKLTYFFLFFSLMTFIPGYPILVGSFFICFGIFQSVQFGREDNDILFSVLLPVKKRDIVSGKYGFTVSVQMIAFALISVFTAIRMIFLNGAEVYTKNAMMNANLGYLGFVLLVFTLFNTVFLGGFFKTAYYFGKPFLFFGISAFLTITVGEIMHHIPALETIGANGCPVTHILILAVCAGIYAAGTLVSLNRSKKKFEKLDI